jgi:predicted O-methyltransferase YrrM
VTTRLRERRSFHRSRLLRELAALVRWARERKQLPDLAHLALTSDWEWGPVQRDEALLLHALVRALRPLTIVEIGFFRGDSTANFLRAADPDARVYAFDNDPACAEVARNRFGDDPRLVFRVRSQETLTGDDLDGRLADFVFIDGAHELALNTATFERLLPLMQSNAIVAIHDTGTISRAFVPDGHWTLDVRERWVGDEYEHQPDERAFANWLLENHPEFSQVHFHSRRVFRHGLTVVQRSEPLDRPSPDTV